MSGGGRTPRGSGDRIDRDPAVDRRALELVSAGRPWVEAFAEALAEREDGARELLRQIASAGGSLRVDEVDLARVEDRLPLRRQARDVIAELRARGVLELDRRAGADPTWRLTPLGLSMIEPTGDGRPG